ncbi:MAG: YrhB domain-containing protein [Lysobacteraceae bacterium]
MLDIVQAREIAKRTIDAYADDCGEPLALLDARTLESDFGWVFFYESARFLESGESSARMAGNAPLIVSRANGEVIVTGTAMPVAHDLARHADDCWRPVGDGTP